MAFESGTKFALIQTNAFGELGIAVMHERWCSFCIQASVSFHCGTPPKCAANAVRFERWLMVA
jgi:hypothetical protein